MCILKVPNSNVTISDGIEIPLVDILTFRVFLNFHQDLSDPITKALILQNL